ncbi:MAG TPA: 2Fe-2S iron-sulfur cluster-binding protein [Caldimonas sp.]
MSLADPKAPDAGDDAADPGHGPGVSRRHFLQAAGAAAGLAPLAAPAQSPDERVAVAPTDSPRPRSPTERIVRLRINGIARELVVEPRVTLLDALREKLALTGTKKGCDRGQCGACTVLVDGRRVNSCLTLAVMHEGREITTIEGLGTPDALREVLALTGTKKGCDRGQCGACTVLVDGRRINSCLTLAVMHEGSEITTIEGLGTPEALHPVQAAFLAHDAFQCGYCTPGQICSAVALVGELRAAALSAATFEAAPTGPSPRTIQISDAEIRERMSGNVCRCGAYTNIVAAVREVAEGRKA